MIGRRLTLSQPSPSRRQLLPSRRKPLRQRARPSAQRSMARTCPSSRTRTPTSPRPWSTACPRRRCAIAGEAQSLAQLLACVEWVWYLWNGQHARGATDRLQLSPRFHGFRVHAAQEEGGEEVSGRAHQPRRRASRRPCAGEASPAEVSIRSGVRAGEPDRVLAGRVLRWRSNGRRLRSVGLWLLMHLSHAIDDTTLSPARCQLGL